MILAASVSHGCRGGCAAAPIPTLHPAISFFTTASARSSGCPPMMCIAHCIRRQRSERGGSFQRPRKGRRSPRTSGSGLWRASRARRRCSGSQPRRRARALPGQSRRVRQHRRPARGVLFHGSVEPDGAGGQVLALRPRPARELLPEPDNGPDDGHGIRLEHATVLRRGFPREVGRIRDAQAEARRAG